MVNPNAMFVLRHYVKMHPFDLDMNDFESCSNEHCFLSIVCYN